MRNKFKPSDLWRGQLGMYYEVPSVKRLHQSVYARMLDYLNKIGHQSLEWASCSDHGYLTLAFANPTETKTIVDMLNVAYRGSAD